MQTRFSKIFILVILLSISLLNSCTFVQDSRDQELEQLQEQINQMATQNASLQDQLSESENDDLNVPSPPEDDSQNQIALSTPTPETLPEDPVPAGVPIVYDGWSMTVSKELSFLCQGECWGLEIFIRNLGETKRTFRFMNAGITAKDDVGNIYNYVNASSMDGTCEEFHYVVKNLEVDGEDSRTVVSSSLGYHQCTRTYGIQMFQGPIPLEVSQLIIMFEDFGPFDGVKVVIDL